MTTPQNSDHECQRDAPLEWCACDRLIGHKCIERSITIKRRIGTGRTLRTENRVIGVDIRPNVVGERFP